MCICIFLSMIVTKYCLFFNNCSFARHLLFVVLVVYNRSCELFCLLIGFVCALFVNFLFCQTICINSIHSLFFRIYFFFYFLPSSSLFLLFFFSFYFVYKFVAQNSRHTKSHTNRWSKREKQIRVLFRRKYKIKNKLSL